MKRINKILCLLFIIPLLAMCFVGCDNKENQTTEQITTQSVELSSSNYKDYLAINTSIIYVEDSPYTTNNTDVENGYLIVSYKITVSPARPNLTFSNCSFDLDTNISFLEDTLQRKIYLDYKGYAESYKVDWNIYLGDINTFGTSSTLPEKIKSLNLTSLTLTNFSGTVTIGE